MNSKTLQKGLLTVGIGLILWGYMNRIMHWPGAIMYMIVGFGLVAVIYPKMMMSKENRDVLDIIKGMSALVFAGFGILYLLYFPEHRNLFKGIYNIGLIAWVSTTIYQHLSFGIEKTSIIAKIINILFIVGTGLVAAGAFYKFMHWPGARGLMVFGVFPFAAAILGIMFSNPEEDEEAD